MLIAVSACGPDLEAMVDERLGRAPYFIIVDSEKLESGWRVVPNASTKLPGGAGVATAQLMVDEGVGAVITGNAGPNAAKVLAGAGIKVFIALGITVEKALAAWAKGELKTAEEPTVSSHYGNRPEAGARSEDVGVLAVATDGDQVAAHFGRCPSYTLVSYKDGREVSRRRIENPGHEPGLLPELLSRHGATHVVAGGMGPRAMDLFAGKGICTVVGVSGSVDDAIAAFLKKRLEGGQSTCEH